MKISKLFHWLYGILMFLPFGLIVFNALASMWSGNTIDLNTWYDMLFDNISMLINYGPTSQNIFDTINRTYAYLIFNIFGLEAEYISQLLSYWTCISIIWLVFDVFMYVPLLVHRWIDKAKIE